MGVEEADTMGVEAAVMMGVEEAVVMMGVVEAVVSVVEAVVSMVEAVNSGLLSLGVPWMAPPDFGRPSYGPVNEICRPSLHSSLAFINLGDLPFNFLYQQSISIMISISLIILFKR